MAVADLTAARLRELLDYSPETGVFVWRVRPKRGRVQAGDVAGTLCQGYRRIGIDGKLYAAHRLAWLHVKGVFPEHDVDHRDGKTANNAFGNLRDATKSQNQQNLHGAKCHSKSGVLGVFWDRRRSKWVAALSADGRQRFYSSHETKDEAIAARRAAVKKFHPFAPSVLQGV